MTFFQWSTRQEARIAKKFRSETVARHERALTLALIHRWQLVLS
jgi:hypothetical protein